MTDPLHIRSELTQLAVYVALRVDDWKPEYGCPAWVESRDSTCGKAPMKHVLCKRHHTIATKRKKKALEEFKAQEIRRAEHRRKMLPEWKDLLAKVEADMERYGGAPTTDRAAYGGASHPSIRRHQMQQLSDTNVQRMAKLVHRAEELRRKIGND